MDPPAEGSKGNLKSFKLKLNHGTEKKVPKARSSVFEADLDCDESKEELITEISDPDFEYKDPNNKKPLEIPLIKKTSWNLEPDLLTQLERVDQEEISKRRERILISIPKTPDERPTPSQNKYGLVIPPKKNGEVKKSPEDNEDEIPLLLRNPVPGLAGIKNPTEKYHHDIKLRPDNVNEKDYEKISVDEFGEAMLRGMGWMEGIPIGKSSKKVVEIYQPETRPHLLGLGAKPIPKELLKRPEWRGTKAPVPKRPS